MRLSSISMFKTRSRSSIDVVRVFSMVGGVRTVSGVLALRLEKEVADLIFLIIKDIVWMVMMMVFRVGCVVYKP